jgi:hypothetical protein
MYYKMLAFFRPMTSSVSSERYNHCNLFLIIIYWPVYPRMPSKNSHRRLCFDKLLCTQDQRVRRPVGRTRGRTQTAPRTITWTTSWGPQTRRTTNGTQGQGPCDKNDTHGQGPYDKRDILDREAPWGKKTIPERGPCDKSDILERDPCDKSDYIRYPFIKDYFFYFLNVFIISVLWWNIFYVLLFSPWVLELQVIYGTGAIWAKVS